MVESSEKPRDGLEETRERETLLDILESAFEKEKRVELTVLEPSGQARTREVFVRGLEGEMLFVSSSAESVVMGISLGDVKAVKLAEKTEN